MAGFSKYVFGKKLVVNLNAKKGYRVSPGSNWRSNAVKACAKNQPLTKRKSCFAASYTPPAGVGRKKK